MWRNSRFLLCFLVALLAGCSARKAPTLYGVEVEGTPFDLMERLVYDAHDECMPVEFLPMNGGMYIFAILANGEEAVIYCETDKDNQITNIKISNTMTGINQQITPPSTCKELTISGLQLAEMLRIAADLLEQQTAQTTKSKPFFPTNDYRRIYIEIEAQRMVGRAFPAPYKTYAELAELLTVEVGWFVDEKYLRNNFCRYTKTQSLKADILRRAAQIG